MRVMLPLAVMLMLNACAPTTGSGGKTSEAFCRAFRPIIWDIADTDETIRAAKSHNAVGVKECGWKGKAT